MTQGKRIRVLIVDDSALVRKILSASLAGEPDIEVVGTAPDPLVARDKIAQLRPDVLTLDIEMPRMNGLTFLKKLMAENPLPVIVISSLGRSSCNAALEALSLGAVEVMAKAAGLSSGGEHWSGLAGKIRAAALSRTRKRLVGSAPPGAPEGPDTANGMPLWPRVIAIGASTGGTEAIARVLTQLPAETPPIVIVQHIPPVFSRAFAQRLDKLCRIAVREAADGDRLAPSTALIAPGNYHMRLEASAGLRVRLEEGPAVCYQRPSVDVLFFSVADLAGAESAAALLTGMGADGAEGLLRLKRAGAFTIAQDEASCTVFGMPREAIRLGAATKILPLDEIARHLAVWTLPRAAVQGKIAAGRR